MNLHGTAQRQQAQSDDGKEHSQEDQPESFQIASWLKMI